MIQLINRTLRWRVAISKCALLAFISMGTLLGATMQNWDSAYVSGLRWWNWVCISVSILITGCNTVYTFLDKTFHTEQEKIKNGDTDSYTKTPETKIGS